MPRTHNAVVQLGHCHVDERDDRELVSEIEDAARRAVEVYRVLEPGGCRTVKVNITVEIVDEASL